MLGPTPGHVTCHRASSPETDPLLQPRRDERTGKRLDELFLAVVINNNTTANRTPNWETTVRLPSVRPLTLYSPTTHIKEGSESKELNPVDCK